jgi:hypothetical protein
MAASFQRAAQQYTMEAGGFEKSAYLIIAIIKHDLEHQNLH